MNSIEVGTIIRLERKRKHLTLRDLSKRCGISRYTIQRIETGYTNANESTLRLVAVGLELPEDFFLRDRPPQADVVLDGVLRFEIPAPGSLTAQEIDIIRRMVNRVGGAITKGALEIKEVTPKKKGKARRKYKKKL